MKMPTSILDKLRLLPRLSEVSSYGPSLVESGPVDEVVEKENASFDSLPILKSFPFDSGRFITFGLVVTKHPETMITNIGESNGKEDRKSTRLNSSHTVISYAVFCLKKKKKQ